MVINEDSMRAAQRAYDAQEPPGSDVSEVETEAAEAALVADPDRWADFVSGFDHQATPVLPQLLVKLDAQARMGVLDPALSKLLAAVVGRFLGWVGPEAVFEQVAAARAEARAEAKAGGRDEP